MFEVDDGMDDFLKNLDFLVKEMPKEAKMVLRRAGSKARTIYARVARQRVKKHTGYYHKKFKRGKVWETNSGYRIRVYNNAPHAHLIEDGHRIVGKDGTEHGFRLGLKVMDKGSKEVEKEWDNIMREQLDKLMEKM